MRGAPLREPGSPLERASIARRVVARLIDAVLVFVAVVVIASAAMATGDEQTVHAARVALAVGPFAYEWLMLGSRGQTVGRLLLKIAVRQAHDSGRISYLRALARILVVQLLAAPIGLALVGVLPAQFLPVLMIPILGGVLSAFRDPHRRAWHDRVAGTIVVRVGR